MSRRLRMKSNRTRSVGLAQIPLSKFSGFQEPRLRDPEVQRSYYYVDTGRIAANVYLYAAACGLTTWFHNYDRQTLATTLRLKGSQRVLFGQTVGYAVGKVRRGMSSQLSAR